MEKNERINETARLRYRASDKKKKQVEKKNRKAIERNRKFVHEYLKKQICVDCGEDDWWVLEFDHVRGKKQLCVSHMVTRAYGVATIEREIAKCEVVCSNCHKRRSIKQLGWSRGRG